MTEPATIPVMQKTKYGIPIRNVWYMLLYAWGETPHSPYWHTINPDNAPSLDGLLAFVLLHLLRQRLRIGLGCSYVAERHMLRGVRGRIQFSESLKRRAFERGQTFCEFENYVINVPKNQIIRSTLFLLARTGNFGLEDSAARNLRHELRQMVRLLEGVDLTELTPAVIHRVLARRQDRDYRVMLSLCDLIVQRQLPSEIDGTVYASQLERERLVFHQLYERFVSAFYRYHLRESWRVIPQKTLYWHEEPHHPAMPVMRPDLVLTAQQSERMIVLDTKFTAQSLKENRWGKEMFASSHLYQMYAYLKTQEHLSPQHLSSAGILLYPTVRQEISEIIALPRHAIRIETVNLAANWSAIEQRLLGLMVMPRPGNGEPHDD